MRKFVALAILTLAACVAYVAIGSDITGAQQPNFIDYYKCYQARHAKRSPRFIPDTVFLTDQFRHNVEVSAVKLNTHCSSADQVHPDGSAASSFQQGLDCYTIRDAPRQPRFTPQNIRVRDKLTNYQDQTLTVSKAQSLCVPSYKSPPHGTAEGAAFVCYQAKRAKGQPRFEQRNRSIRDQTGRKDVRVIRPVAYCTETEKKVDATNDDFNTNQDPLPDSNFCDEVGNIVECQDHVSTVHTGPEDNDPIISCKTDYSHSVWYHWQSTASESIILDTEGTTYDTVVAVFTGDKAELSQNEVACNENPSSDDPLQFDATAYVTYHILVASSDGHGGKLKFHLRTKKDGPDTCSNTTSDANRLSSLTFIGDSDLVHRSTMNALPAGVDCPADAPTTICGTPEHTVWFNYRVPTGQTQEVRFDASDSSYNTLVAVFRGPLIDCGIPSVTASPLLSGLTYHVMVGDVDPNREGGKLKLRWSLVGSIPAGSQAGATQQGTPSNSLTCYQVRQARHQTETDQLWDQFSIRQLGDPWLLTIGGVDSLCVPSTKDPCSGAAAYTNGFQGNVGSEWSDTSTDTTPVGNRRFLGQFAEDDAASLTLDNLPSHSSVTVCFDLFIIQSMDGADNESGQYGPDVWDLSVNGDPTPLLHTTFSNEDETPRNQNYPNSYPGGKNPPHTGAAEIDTLGYDFFGDSVYRLVFTFAHTDGSLQLNFSGSGLQDIGDESWGLDNVVVKVH